MAQKRGMKHIIFTLLWPGRGGSQISASDVLWPGRGWAKIALLLSYGPRREIKKNTFILLWKAGSRIVLSALWPRRGCSKKNTFHFLCPRSGWLKIAPALHMARKRRITNITFTLLSPGTAGSKITLSTFMPQRTETKHRTFAFLWSGRKDQTYQLHPLMAQKMVIKKGIFAFVWPGRGRSNIARSLFYGPEEG